MNMNERLTSVNDPVYLAYQEAKNKIWSQWAESLPVAQKGWLTLGEGKPHIAVKSKA